MNIKVKRLVAILCALLLLGVLLAFAQALLLPKYMSDEKKEGALAAEYYTYAENRPKGRYVRGRKRDKRDAPSHRENAHGNACTKARTPVRSTEPHSSALPTR